jgi:hypothetical protein
VDDGGEFDGGQGVLGHGVSYWGRYPFGKDTSIFQNIIYENTKVSLLPHPKISI